MADGLRLLEIHEGMLGVVLLLDAVEEVAEVAPDVAGLPEPHHAASGQQLVASLEVARRRRWPLTRSASCRNLSGHMLASAGARVPTHRIRRLQDGRAPVNWRIPARAASRAGPGRVRRARVPAEQRWRTRPAGVATRLPRPCRAAAGHARPDRWRGRTAPSSRAPARG